MKQARIQHIIKTLTEIMSGYRILGSPLSEKLLNLCPGEIQIDLLKGEVKTNLEKKDIVSELTEPFIEYIRKEIEQDRGLPHIESCEITFTIGNSSKFSNVTELHYDFDVKKDSSGKAYRTDKTHSVKYFGKQYEIAMLGFIIHGNKRHDFSDSWQMQVEEGREE